MKKPIAGTEAAETENIPVATTQVVEVEEQAEPMRTDPTISDVLKKIEETERRLAEQEQRLIDREKELDSRIATAGTNSFKASEANKAVTEKRHEDKAQRMKEHLAKQPKVRMFVPLVGVEKIGTILPVTMNGYRLNVPKGVYVDVPQQVADLLKVSLQQTEESGRAYRLDLSDDEKKKALGV